ncbi:MAG: tyrosine recombinase XerC [Bacteroidales bacterium]|nr:tyrosine recombinase XerC [Bacteroidales bacterium]
MQKFLDYLRFEKRSSEHTVEAYRVDLQQFSEYLQVEEGNPDILRATSADIRSWMIQLMEEGVTARSINRKVSALRAFYRYHLKMKDVAVNPTEVITAPKLSKRLPQFVEEREMDTLFQAELFPDDFEGKRDQLIIELFYVTGMRLSELIGIRRGDIDLYDGSVKVLGKRNKERIIPFSPRVKVIITDYLKLFDEKYAGNPKNSFIFVAQNGNKIYPKAVYRIVRKYLDLVTTIDKRSPHVLRHTFATQMLNHGADINAIKEILGHSSLAATQVYTHNSIEKLKNIYNQAHPRA